MMIWEHQSSGWYYRTLIVVAAAAAIVAEVWVGLAAIAIGPVAAAAVWGIHLEIGLLQTFLVVVVERIPQRPGNQLALGIGHCQIHLAVGCYTFAPVPEPIHFAVASAAEVVRIQIDQILVAFPVAFLVAFLVAFQYRQP